MNDKLALRRTRRRHLQSGYTLMEMMVVVVIVAITAALAAPSFIKARGERIAFSYARQVGDIVHNARARAEARGSAHLVVYSQTFGGTRGAVLSFEALDGVPVASGGPNPVQSCKGANWTDVATFSPGATSLTSPIVDALNINNTANGSVEVTENIYMTASATTSLSTAATTQSVIVICTQPSGTTYVGYGADLTTAMAMMQAQPPFTGLVEVDVARHVQGSIPSTVTGLTRRVIIPGGAAPRIQSQ